MMSAFGVAHPLSKVAWKAWSTVPPGVGKIPRSRLNYAHTHGEGTAHRVEASLRHSAARSSPAGFMDTSFDAADYGHKIDNVKVAGHLRRRGVATNLKAAAERHLGETVDHSASRTQLGDRFAAGHARKSGGAKPPPNDRPVRSGLKRKPFNPEGEPYYTRNGIQRDRAYEPRTVAAVRRRQRKGTR